MSETAEDRYRHAETDDAAMKAAYSWLLAELIHYPIYWETPQERTRASARANAIRREVTAHLIDAVARLRG